MLAHLKLSLERQLSTSMVGRTDAMRRRGALVALVVLSTCLAVSAAPVFTGNVESDFTVAGSMTIVDPTGVDVGVPSVAPPGVVSGNDMKDVRMYHDPATDVLYVGLNTYVIAGDVDDDGDPGGTASWLAGLGGEDNPDFGGSESFAVMFDIDEDGTFDVIAGVAGAADTSGYSVNVFSGVPFAPAFAFGAPLPGHTGVLHASPHLGEPDLELTITNFSALPTSGPDTDLRFGFLAYVGSFADAGIGEDLVRGEGMTRIPEPATVLLFGVPGIWLARRRRARRGTRRGPGPRPARRRRLRG